MNARPDTKTTEWSATVAVRVPQSDDGTLATAASRRLATTTGIENAEVVAIEAIEPALAATVVRVAVRLGIEPSLAGDAVETCIADAPGVQRVDELEMA